MVLPILFAGTPDVAVAPLRALVEDKEHFDVRAVLTRPDAPTGRGRKLVPSAVKKAAIELGIPVLEVNPSNEQECVSALKATGARIAAVVAYGKILKQSVLDALPLGWYNLHFSLLPQWRGAAPVQRAIWAGDDITGATVFKITRGMDEGPILAQMTTEIGAHETAGDLLTRLSNDGANLLCSALVGLESGQIVPVEQDSTPCQIAQKITVEDAHIRFDIPSFAIDRQIRACTPNPGAWCNLHVDSSDLQTITLHVLACALAKDEDIELHSLNELKPGQILAKKHNVWVGCASGAIELLEVKSQGKKAMNAADWARGAHLSSESYLS